MKAKVSNVKWDLTDYTEEEREDILNELPESFVVDTEFDEVDENNIEDYLEDVISDLYGYCHFGFDFTIVEE